MKDVRILILLACATAWFAAAVPIQAESCCQKAKKDRMTCAHKCCIEAAKAKKSCQQCNKKKETKEEKK